MRWEAMLAAGAGVALVASLEGMTAGGVARAEEPASTAESAAVPEPVGDEVSRAIAELAQRIAELEQRAAQDPEVQGPLNGAKVALEGMRQARARGDRAAGARADALARAGVALAERRYALSLEKALLRAAHTRREGARARAEASARARAAEERRLEQLEVSASAPAPESSP